MNEVFAFLLFGRRWRIEVDFSNFDQILDIMRNLIGSSDLLRELPFMYHSLSPEETEDEYISKQSRGGVHLDGMESIEELDPIELEDELSEYLLAQEGGFAFAVEEDDSEETICLLS